jgi:N-formylglutamate deformylase
LYSLPPNDLFMDVFKVVKPKVGAVPILLSIPHCGTSFPAQVKDQFKQNLIISPDDTDWFVDRLYGFAEEMGITTISAVCSRWVVDLNRHPQSKPLYSDGRIITGLCPTTDFLGNLLYNDGRGELSEQEIQDRLSNYYWPYHEALLKILIELKSEFGKVLLWDCHSIRQVVPTIQKEKFPDLILGDADGTSASPGVIETTLKQLESSNYSLSHNHPFKGGYITRQYGRPSENIHALQLEMTKVNYMEDSETQYDEVRALRMEKILKGVFGKLIEGFFN